MHDDNETPMNTPNGKDAFIQSLFIEAEVDLGANEMEAATFTKQVERRVRLAAWQDKALKKIIVRSGWKPAALTVAAAASQDLLSPLIVLLEAPLITMDSSIIATLLSPMNSGAFVAAIILLSVRKFVKKLALFN